MTDRFQKTLGLSSFSVPEDFSDILAAALKEYEEKGAFFLEESYLRRLQKDCDAFPRTLDAVLAGVERLRQDRNAADYALSLVRAMELRVPFKRWIQTFPLLEQTHPMFGFFCLVPSIEKTYGDLKRRGVDADIIAQTVNQYEDCLFVYEKRFGKLGLNMRYFNHLQEYVDCEILNVDRLRFGFESLRKPVYLLRKKGTAEYVLLVGDGEMTAGGMVAKTAPAGQSAAFTASFRETEEAYVGTPALENGTCSAQISTYNKKEYELVLRPGDLCLSTHIHPYGELSREACMASYRRVLELVARFYPEYRFKAFYCNSWMMSPELKDVMKPTSKVLDFQSFYLRFPVATEGKAVLNFVFYMKGADDYTQLPEDTSLQRALKQRYLAGGRLNEYGGIMPFDWIRSPEDLWK